MPSRYCTIRTERAHGDSPNSFQLPHVPGGIPASAQPTTNKARKVKKGKKVKKSLLPHGFGGPWPPRSNDAVNHMAQDVEKGKSTEQVQVVSDAMGGDQNSPSHDGLQRVRKVASSKVTDEQETTTATGRSTPQAEHGKAPLAPGTTIVKRAPSVMMLSTCEGVGAEGHSSAVSFERFSLDPARIPDTAISQPTLQTRENADNQDPAAQGAPSLSVEGLGLVRRSVENSEVQDRNTVDELAAPTSGLKHSIQEAILHATSDRLRPSRVHKRIRATQATLKPLPRQAQPGANSAIEHNLENLRVAILAEEFRKSHELTTFAKHHEEITSALQSHIKLQDATISGLVKQNESHTEKLTSFAEKAKTNQKYVVGLQSDHVKLQKSVASYEQNNKAALQAQIAELEGEKDALRTDFEKTLDALAKSQGKMKSALKDAWDHVKTLQEKERNLRASLHQEISRHHEERKKREVVEANLLVTVRDIQHQIGNSSTSLITKLEKVQSNISATITNDAQKDTMRECLVALQGLLTSPSLDVAAIQMKIQKAEGMLHCMQKR